MSVMIFNAGGQQALGVVSYQHAIGMLVRRVATVHEAVPGQTFGPYPAPRSLELVRWVYTRWLYEATGARTFSRLAVLRRDRYRCAYCGRTGTTIDHIVPKSRGGRTSWTNCVAACASCNGKKANATPEEAGMRLTIVPRVPSPRDRL